MVRTLVIIPAYNEQDSLEHTMEELEGYLGTIGDNQLDYLIVNDGSTDATRSICLKNDYLFLDLPINTGLASAFQTGMKYAQRHSYDYAIQFDADGQHNPESLLELINTARESEADIVIGSRFLDEKKGHSMRALGSSFIIGMIRITARQKITDPTSGLRLFGPRMIDKFVKDCDFAPEPDTVAFAMRNGAKVVEIPVTMRERYGGKSYLTATKSISYMTRMGFSILLYQWFRKA